MAPTPRRLFLLQMAQCKNADAINNMQKPFLQTPCYESTNPSWEMRIRDNTVHLTIWIAELKRVVGRRFLGGPPSEEKRVGRRTLVDFKGADFFRCVTLIGAPRG